MDIGTKLKSLRTQNGLTQQELADRAELTKGFISQVERNLTSPSIVPSQISCSVLAAAFRNFLQMTHRNRLSFGKKIIF